MTFSFIKNKDISKASTSKLTYHSINNFLNLVLILLILSLPILFLKLFGNALKSLFLWGSTNGHI